MNKKCSIPFNSTSEGSQKLIITQPQLSKSGHQSLVGMTATSGGHRSQMNSVRTWF